MHFPTPPGRRRWYRANHVAAAAVRSVVDDLDIAFLAPIGPRTGRRAARTGHLVLGSSQGPRDVGLTSFARDGLRVVANRGVAGIDGTVSTAVGVALTAEDNSTRTRARPWP